MTSKKPDRQPFFLLLSLIWSFAWLAWQYGQQLGRVNGKVSLEDTLSDMLANPPTALQMTVFALATAGLYATFGVLNALAFSRLIAPRISSLRRKLAYLSIQLTLACISVEFVTAWCFPVSTASNHVGVFISRPVSQIAAGILLVSTLTYFIVALWPRRHPFASVAITAALVASCTVGSLHGPSTQEEATPNAKPDLVVIGIDSLRPDHLTSFGAPMTTMPHLEAWLRESMVFRDTLTPLPNTFPATVSILTGRYPTHHGARNNLFPPSMVKSDLSIAHQLRAAGYHTIMAMDETRFANIDETYGFDQIVGPSMGSADFLMSVAGDNALSLLASSTPVGKWIFPLFDGNRGFAQAYKPMDTSRKLGHAIDTAPSDQPLFLYTHFCAAHWPYMRPDRQPGETPTLSRQPAPYADDNWMYLQALSDADRQFESLIAGLTKAKRLRNALIVVLSDHGEELGMEKDRMKNETFVPLADRFLGHGKSAIQPTQVRVLLGLRGYGPHKGIEGNTALPVSLIDVAPTLLETAGLPTDPSQDGQSLLFTLNGRQQSIQPNRMRFVESAWMPNAMKRGQIDEVKVAEEAAKLMEVMPNGRLQIRASYTQFQIDWRQRAVYKGNWALMAPELSTDPFLLFERDSQRVMPISAKPKGIDLEGMRGALCSHWKGDTKFQRERCLP